MSAKEYSRMVKGLSHVVKHQDGQCGRERNWGERDGVQIMQSLSASPLTSSSTLSRAAVQPALHSTRISQAAGLAKLLWSKSLEHMLYWPPRAVVTSYHTLVA